MSGSYAGCHIHRMFAGSPRRIGEGYSGGGIPAPRAIIAGQGPEIPLLDLASAGIKPRGCGLVHEQLGGLFEVLQQRVVNRGEFAGRLAHPGGQRDRGAAVTNLSHNASFHANERITPSKPGIKQLKRPAKNLTHGVLAGGVKHRNVALHSPFSLSQVKGRTLWVRDGRKRR